MTRKPEFDIDMMVELMLNAMLQARIPAPTASL